MFCRLTEALALVGGPVDEDLGADDVAEGQEHLHQLGVAKLLREVVDEEVAALGPGDGAACNKQEEIGRVQIRSDSHSSLPLYFLPSHAVSHSQGRAPLRNNPQTTSAMKGKGVGPETDNSTDKLRECDSGKGNGSQTILRKSHMDGPFYHLPFLLAPCDDSSRDKEGTT